VSRTKSSANRRAKERLAFQSSPKPRGGWAIPVRWLKNLCGVFLLPVAVVLTWTFFGLFSKAGRHSADWTVQAFRFFVLGGGLWGLWFVVSMWAFGRPRPIRAYVFGHELTHAIWVWMWGGRVSRFEVSRDGGYILTDTHNFWIALAPYFYPIYSFAVILGFGLASLFCDFTRVENTFLLFTPVQWLFLLLGATWAFHLSFTLWMIPKGQTDLIDHGVFFSLVIIYMMNVLLLTVFLVAAARELTFAGYVRDLIENAHECAALLVKWGHEAWQSIKSGAEH
jgi:hypothetical protein